MSHSHNIRRPAGRRRPRGPVGFTLVELLVVIAAFAILAVLITPVIASARKSMAAGACAHNMRNFSQAVLAYTADHDGVLLPVLNESNGLWYGALISGEYLPKESDLVPLPARKLRCPANENGAFPRDLNASLGYRNGYPNYCYNATTGTLSPTYNPAPNFPNPPKRLTQIQRPAQKAMFMEAGEYKVVSTPFRATTIIGQVNAAGPIWVDPENKSYIVADVHGNASNVLFFDGHIERIPKGQIDWKIIDLNQP